MNRHATSHSVAPTTTRQRPRDRDFNSFHLTVPPFFRLADVSASAAENSEGRPVIVGADFKVKKVTIK